MEIVAFSGNAPEIYSKLSFPMHDFCYILLQRSNSTYSENPVRLGAAVKRHNRTFARLIHRKCAPTIALLPYTT